MPRDLFAEQNNSVSPNAGRQPQDLFAANNIAPINMPTAQNVTGLARPLADIGAGIAGLLAGALNLPSDIGSLLSKAATPGFAPAVQMATGILGGAFAPQNFLPSQVTSAIPRVPDINWLQKFGVPHPNLGDIALSKGIEYSPLIYGGARALPMLARGAGGVMSALGSGLDTLSGKIADLVLGKAPDVSGAAQDIMQTLGGGKSLADNAADLGASIKNAYENNLATSQSYYKPVFDNIKNQNIYDPAVDSSQAYAQLQDVADNYLPDTANLHQQFLDNPTLQNAHDLQSQLGYEIRGLQKQQSRGVLNRADQATLQNLTGARNALQSDVNQFLGAADPSGMTQGLYNASTNYYANNVAPYKNNPLLAQIATGNITNPAKIMSSINPILKTESSDQLASDIGPSFNDMVAYQKLGGPNMADNPQKLLNNLNTLENTSPQYISPTLSALKDSLESTINNANARDVAMKGIKRVAVGAGLISALPFLKNFL